MDILENLIERYAELSSVKEDIQKAYEIMKDCFSGDGKLLIAGNGGSAADAEHMVGELMKSFVRKRPMSDQFGVKLMAVDREMGTELAEKLQGALPAIALTGHEALTTAYANDVDGTLTFAQQLNGYGRKGDVFLGISTSGNSKNVLYAAVTAKAKGMKTIVLTGRDGGSLKKLCDISVVVPETETYKIQELHLPIYHAWCLMLEEYFFKFQ